jgi:hypothetical protein
VTEPFRDDGQRRAAKVQRRAAGVAGVRSCAYRAEARRSTPASPSSSGSVWQDESVFGSFSTTLAAPAWTRMRAMLMVPAHTALGPVRGLAPIWIS